ncbi:MAG: VOC family protein [Gaiellaceae bacterium]
MTRARAVGINHVALEVGSLDDALAFYGSIFELTLRARVPGMAFVDLGDQFLALAERAGREPDGHRHFGLVVDDKEAARQAVRAAGIEVQPEGKLRFRDPWGNNVEVVAYRDVQFTKDARVLRGMGLDLSKRESALAELRESGLAD